MIGKTSFGTIEAKELLNKVVNSGGRDKFPLPALLELKKHFPQLNGASKALENAIRLAAREEGKAAIGQPAMPQSTKWLAKFNGDWKAAVTEQVRLLIGDPEGEHGRPVPANTNWGYIKERKQVLKDLMQDPKELEPWVRAGLETLFPPRY